MATGNCTHSSLVQANFDGGFAFTCNGYRDFGYGSCYTCYPQCNYHLHNECHMRQPIMDHAFFTQGNFMLKENNGSQNLLCEACGMSVEGWRYASSIEGGSEITLHPCCINLPHSNVVNGMLFTLIAKLKSRNMCCAHFHQSNGVKGWAYVSEKSNLAFHVKCLKEMRHQNWSRDYYSPIHQNNSNFKNVHQQKDLNQNRFRKRDLIYGAVKLALSIIGLGDPSDGFVTMVELAINIWGSGN